MALVPLFDEVNQFNDYNGTVLAAGRLFVYHLGRTRLADIYSDLNGTVMQNPVTLDNLGRGPIYVSQDFNYTLVVMDEYGQEMFSQDKFIYSQGGPHNSANVAVGASEYIAVSSTQIGDTTVYTPYLTGTVPGSGGKTYSGIDPIVVNNDEDKISANTVPFGVQEPLYFVEDETATIIGISGNPSADAVNWVTAQNYLRSPDLIGYATKDFVEEEVSGKYDTSAFSTISGAFLTALPEGSMNESAFGYSGGLITSYNGSAFKAGDEFPQSATDAIQVVTSNSGNWDGSYSAVTSNSASWNDVSGKLDESAFSSVSGDFQTTAGMTAYQPAGDYLTTGDSSNFYTTANPSGFITGVDLTPYQTTAGMTAYASKDDVSGLQSASVWNDAVNTVSSNSASWTGIEYTGVSPIVVDNATRSISADTWTVTFGSGLSAIDDTANSATTIVVTAQGGGGAGGDMFVSGLAYTTGGEISSYSGSAFASTDPTYELSAGDGISLTTGASTLTISFTGSSGNMDVAGLEYTTGGEISSYSGSAFASTDPTYELSAGDGILLTTGAGSLTIAVALSTGSI